MKTWPLAFLAAVMLAVSSSESAACSCACDASVTVDDYIDSASLIVIGRVVALRPGPPSPHVDSLVNEFAAIAGVDPQDLTVVSSCSDRTVQIVVEQVLKGNAVTELTLAQHSVGTSCDFGFPLRVGRAYLLFGLPGDNGNTVYLPGCSPSLPAAKAQKMIARVRKRLAGAS